MQSNENKHLEEKKASITLGNLYDFNKQAMLSQKSLNAEQIKSLKPALEEWFNWRIDGYAILLCRERYDFTIFHLYEKENPNPPEVAVKELIELLLNRGEILSIEKDNIDNMVWEIWLKIGNEVFAYYLFNCDEWVIEC